MTSEEVYTVGIHSTVEKTSKKNVRYYSWDYYKNNISIIITTRLDLTELETRISYNFYYETSGIAPQANYVNSIDIISLSD